MQRKSPKNLTCIFEGITTCIVGNTFNLNCSPQYNKLFEQRRHKWSPIIPKFHIFLVSSPRISRSSTIQCPVPKHLQLLTKFSAGKPIILQQSITNG